MDATFAAEDGFFSYRVGAMILHAGRVLMVKNANAPYYYSVGGRVHVQETSEQAVVREVWEETRCAMAVERLAFIHENFFAAEYCENRPFHEIALYYLMRPHPDYRGMDCDSIGCNGGRESLHWLPIEELAAYPVFPAFFPAALAALPAGIQHFVTRQGRTEARP